MSLIDVFSAKGFPASPHLVDRKKSAVVKKISAEAASSTSRLTALPATTNKTIFFLPGVDIKVIFFVDIVTVNVFLIFLCEESKTYFLWDV